MRVLGRLLFGAIAASALLGVGSACRALDPPNRPLDRCEAQCREKAKRNCSEDACVRGCEFILDRLIEREGPNVIACVARYSRGCSDVVWAECASHVGVHADGGPPGPAPRNTEEDE